MNFVYREILPHMEEIKKEAHIALVEEFKDMYHLNTWFMYERIISDREKYPTFNNGVLKNKNQMCRVIKEYLVSLGAVGDAAGARAAKRLKLPDGYWSK